MTKLFSILILAVFGALSGSVCSAFQSSHNVRTLVTTKSTTLNMAPRYDKLSQKWIPSDPAVRAYVLLRLSYLGPKLMHTSPPSLFSSKYATQTEGPQAGYNIIGSLYRAGPMPAITRLTNPENYEQAVLKFMAKEGCGRVVSRVRYWI